MKERSATASHLLAAAHQLILERGYNAFSYADLSERVGIRKASIHHHFPTKAELVTVLLQQYRHDLHAQMMAILPQLESPEAMLSAYSGYWATCIGDHSQPMCLAALLAAELPSLPESVAAEVRDHFANLAFWLEKVFAEIPDQTSHASAAARAELFLATVHGAMLSARASGNPAIFEIIMHQAINATVRRVSAP